MNTDGPRPPSRFVRGRARGGGAYRPYFYFRRNGRTIPANRRNGDGGDNGQGDETNIAIPPFAGRYNRGGRGRGRGGWPSQPISASFLRPEFYAVPEDAVKAMSIVVDNKPSEYPGWRFYFLTDTFDGTSELVKRVKTFQTHFQNQPLKYDLLTIAEESHFTLEAYSIINNEEIKTVWPTLGNDLQMSPLRTMATIALAMHTAVSFAVDTSLNPSNEGVYQDIYIPRVTSRRKVYVRPVNFIPVDLIANIRKDHVDQLYAVRGIVTMVGDPVLQVAWLAFACTRCKAVQALRQKGSYKSQPFFCKNSTNCTAKKNFQELRSSPYSRFKSRQFIRLEESSVQLLTDYDSKMPGSLEIELTHDLVDTFTVGDEVVITGIIKMHEIQENEQATTSAVAGKEKNNTIQLYMKAVAIQNAKYIKREFSKRDLEAISMINEEKDSFKLLVQSLTPEVHGHEVAKAGCLLSLFGGAGSQLGEEAALNVLLVGDPDTGKSKILQTCAQISERGAHVNGKRSEVFGNKLGATFVGRNANYIQAGSLMTASTGHCTVDDIDKLATQHSILVQTMQSQEINLPSSTIFSKLQAYPSIIASANPQSGKYDRSRYFLKNVSIMPSLMREFHLAFVLLDQPNINKDVSLTEHVRALHKGVKKREHIAINYAMKPKANDSITFNFGDDDDVDNVNKTFDDEAAAEPYNIAKRLAINSEEGEELDLLPPILMKKFIAYARQNVNPLLNDEASNDIKEFFMDLKTRTVDDEGRKKLGPSQLVGLIHMAQARARIDLSNEVTRAHVRDVIAIVCESMAQISVGSIDCTSGDGFEAKCSSLDSKIDGASAAKQLKRFIAVLQVRSDAIGRRIFDFDELKDIARRAGIMCGVTNLVDYANMHGFILKKGVNLYEVVPE